MRGIILLLRAKCFGPAWFRSFSGSLVFRHDKQAILDEMTAFQTKVQKLIKKVDDAQKGVQDAITKSQKLVASKCPIVKVGNETN